MDKYKKTIISIIAALTLWTGESLLDAFQFNPGAPLASAFFSSPLEKLYSGALILAIIFIFGWAVSTMFSQRNPAQTALQKPAEELRVSESFLGTIFDSIHDPFSIVDRGYRIVKVNQAYAAMKNKSVEDLLGKPCYEVLQGGAAICKECVVEKTFQSKDPCAKEKLVKAADGSELWLEIYTYPILDGKGAVSHVIEYARDITERKMAERENSSMIKKLNQLSTTDVLTGLFNRRALNDLLNLEIGRAKRYCSDLSVMLCDIDKFKLVNDTHGHSAGDLALQTFSKALINTIRKSDIVGRYGGDEFMIILPETSLKGAKKLAEKIRSAVEDVELKLSNGNTIRLSTSIGVASCCAPMEDIDTIVARADTALYASKNTGRNKVSAIAA